VKKQEISKKQAENKQKVQGVGFEPPVGWRYRQFFLFYAASLPFFKNSSQSSSSIGIRPY
jgi:hypothetical protein